ALLALTSLEASVRLVDDVGAAAAADHAAIPVARLQRLQAIANLHGRAPASFSYCCVVGLVQEPAAHLESGPAEVKARILVEHHLVAMDFDRIELGEKALSEQRLLTAVEHDGVEAPDGFGTELHPVDLHKFAVDFAVG